MKLETRIWVQQNCNNSDSSELGMWGVQRDADQLHLRDAHVSLNAGRVPAAKIQNAGFLNLWHVLHFSHHKKNLSGKCFPVTLYGDHSVVRLTKLASSAETQLLTITKIHFHLHSQRKENKHLTEFWIKDYYSKVLYPNKLLFLYKGYRMIISNL